MRIDWFDLTRFGTISRPKGASGSVTPYGYEFYGSRDMLKKQDFIVGLSALSGSSRIDPRGRADANYMLSLYQKFTHREEGALT